MGGRKEEGWRVQQSLVVPHDPKDWITLVYPYPTSLDPFEWLENDGGRSTKRGRKEREPPLIGRMIPANPENGGSPASLCQKLEGKWAKCHAFGRQKPGESPWTGWRWRGYVGRTKDSSIDSRSEEFSKRKESLALVNRGRGCFLPEWWNF